MAISALNGTKIRGRYRPLSEINVTPMVDVMLVLLIIFMVTAPLMTSGVPVDLPKTSAQPLNSDSEPVTVSINAEGKIYLQEAEVQLGDLVPQTAGNRAEQSRPQDLRARRQGSRLRPHHGGDGHRHPGRLYQGRAAGRADRPACRPPRPGPAHPRPERPSRPAPPRLRGHRLASRGDKVPAEPPRCAPECPGSSAAALSSRLPCTRR